MVNIFLQGQCHSNTRVSALLESVMTKIHHLNGGPAMFASAQKSQVSINSG